MGNVKSEERLEKVVESYIFNHFFKMTIFIERNEQDKFDVLYANSLARQYFSTEIEQSATSFFGDLWIPIKRRMRKLQNQSNFSTEIQSMRDGLDRLYELDFQRHTEEYEREIIVIELRERLDSVTARKSQSELQHKYNSVIENNLDPIITIDQNFKITYANRALLLGFGYRFKELSGRSILNLSGEDKIEEFKIFLSRALEGESIEIEDSTIFHNKGYLLPTYLKAIPVLIDGDVEEVQLIVRDTSIHQKNNEKLLYLSYHDHLTGLWNRQKMKEHFTEDSLYALKSEKSLSFVHLGLDRFKLINDSLGHNGADEILKMVAERLKVICPTSARLYRNGSDEFIVSLQNHSVSNTEKFAQQLLNEFGKPFYYNHQEYFISASIGIAVYPEDGKTLEDLLRKSKQALAFVKDRGRSHYRFYQKAMNSTFPDEALMESHLRRAIELNELTIHYQPQVDLKTGHISSFEALLKME